MSHLVPEMRASSLGTLPVLSDTSDTTTQPLPKLKVELVPDAVEVKALPHESNTTYYGLSVTKIDGTTCSIQKRYTNFEELHKELAQIWDIQSLPAMPKKGFWRKTFNPNGAFMANRKKDLAEILLFASSQTEAQPALTEFVNHCSGTFYGDGSRAASAASAASVSQYTRASFRYENGDDVDELNGNAAGTSDSVTTYGTALETSSLLPGPAAAPHAAPQDHRLVVMLGASLWLSLSRRR